jgi:hypothetical protein
MYLAILKAQERVEGDNYHSSDLVRQPLKAEAYELCKFQDNSLY